MSDVKWKFGNGVKKRRLELGLTQEELAAISGLHRTYIADVERGERNISILNIVNLIYALDITVADFFSQYFPETHDKK
ncbi:MAG: helix-turn-helix domain-containing protein [Bellilinea sp.]